MKSREHVQGNRVYDLVSEIMFLLLLFVTSFRYFKLCKFKINCIIQ